MGDGRESLIPAPNYNTPVKDLTYKDLLTNTFTQTSHDRGIKTWCVQTTYPECLYWGKKYRYERFNVEWTWTLEKQLGRKGLSHLVKNHYQHHVVLIENVFNRNLLPWDIEFVIDESVHEQEEDIFHILLWWNWVNSKEPKLNCVYTEREILLFY